MKEVYEKKGEEFLRGLLNGYVIISEKVDGTLFGLKKTREDEFRYFKKTGEITHVDRVLMKYFNPAIDHFDSISEAKRKKIPVNFYFGFEYFTRGDSKMSKYDRLPKNGLVLSYIHRLDDRGKVEETSQNKELLDRWADYLEVERPPIIFEGHLDEEQKNQILEFVYTPAKELVKKFKTNSFTKHILSVLTDGKQSPFLKEQLEDGIDEIVFRFYDESDPDAKTILAKVVDPIFQERAEGVMTPKQSKSQDYIWLIVIDLMNQFETYDIEEIKDLVKEDEDYAKNYVRIIDFIFKDFVKEYEKKYEGLKLDLPDYMKRPEFEMDSSLIEDSEVERLVSSNETYAEIYKIALNFFRRVRKKSSSSFFTKGMLTQLNIIVTKIRNIIMGDALYEGFFPSFNEFIGEADGDLMNENDYSEVAHKKIDPIEANILVGSFQPVTLGHIQAAKKMMEKNGKPTVIVAIKADRKTKKSPFSLQQTKKMLQKVRAEYPDLIIDAKIIPAGTIEEVLETVQPKYRPLLWGTSERRAKDYALQLDHVRKRKVPIRLSTDFKIVEIPSFVKSEEVMASIANSDFAEFKRLVPNSIVSEFFNLQKELEENRAVQEPVKKKLFENVNFSAEVVDQSEGNREEE